MHSSRKKHSLLRLWLALALCLSQLSSYSCEALSFKDSASQVWMAKDFMFEFGAGRVFINQRGVKKTAFSLVWNRAVWQSKYASVSFNQPARDFPFGGMNEKGVGMEILWHNAEYPEGKKGEVINESQMIQYVLDLAASTEEAIALMKSLTVQRMYAYVHYMICDSTNDCRVVEYDKGQIKVIPMPQDIFRQIGNDNYEDELKYLVHLKENSPDNYVELFREMNSSLNASNEEISNSVFAFFDRTNGLSKTSWSKWHITYNLSQQKVWFRSYLSKDAKYIDLNDFEKECRRGTPELTTSINATPDEFSMVPFSKKINKEMIATYDYIPPVIRYFGEMYSRMSHKCMN